MESKRIWITRKEAEKIVGSPRYIQRFLSAGWLTVIRKGAPGTPALFTYASLEAACERVRRGEEPPLLNSESEKPKTM